MSGFNLPPGVTNQMIEEAQGEAYKPKKIACPTCQKRILLAPAGHFVYHLTPLGWRCKASGGKPEDYR
jgi:hypothetical protein